MIHGKTKYKRVNQFIYKVIIIIGVLKYSHPECLPVLIFDLNSIRGMDIFILSGTCAHTLGPLKDKQSLCAILTVFAFILYTN